MTIALKTRTGEGNGFNPSRKGGRLARILDEYGLVDTVVAVCEWGDRPANRSDADDMALFVRASRDTLSGVSPPPPATPAEKMAMDPTTCTGDASLLASLAKVGKKSLRRVARAPLPPVDNGGPAKRVSLSSCGRQISTPRLESKYLRRLSRSPTGRTWNTPSAVSYGGFGGHGPAARTHPVALSRMRLRTQANGSWCVPPSRGVGQLRRSWENARVSATRAGSRRRRSPPWGQDRKQTASGGNSVTGRHARRSPSACAIDLRVKRLPTASEARPTQVWRSLSGSDALKRTRKAKAISMAGRRVRVMPRHHDDRRIYL